MNTKQLDYEKLIQTISSLDFNKHFKKILLSTLNSIKNNSATEQEMLAVFENLIKIREEVEIYKKGEEFRDVELVFYLLARELFRFKSSRSLFYKEIRFDYERKKPKGNRRPFLFLGLFEFFMLNTNEIEINEIFKEDLGIFHEIFYESHTLLYYFDCDMEKVPGKEFSKFIKLKIQKCGENDDIEEFYKIYRNFFRVLETDDLLELFSFDRINIIPFLLKNISDRDIFYKDLEFDYYFKKNLEVTNCISETLLKLLPSYSVDEWNDPLYLLGFFECLSKKHIQLLIADPKVDFFSLLMKFQCTEWSENKEFLKKFIVERDVDFCQLCREVIKENNFEKIYWFWDRWLLEILEINDLKRLLEDQDINFVESLLKAAYICKYKDEVGINYYFSSKLKQNYNLRSLMAKQITRVIKKYEKESFIPLLAMRLIDFLKPRELLDLLEDSDINLLTKINDTIESHYDEIMDLNESFYRWKINFLKFLTKFNVPVSEQIDRIEPAENLLMSLAPADEEVEESYIYFDNDAELEGLKEHVSIAGRKITVIDGILALSGLNLYDLDEVEGLFELKTIKVLSLSNNFIKKLPDEIGNLTSLEQLIIENCNLTSIPESIGKLTNIKKINLHSTNLSSLPESFGNLLRLEDLDVSFNDLKQLPKSFKNLVNLKYLNLRHNKFTDIPYWLGDVKNLRELNLMSNKFLSKIPESIGNLTSLRKLDLWGTWFRALPQSIYKLKNLKELNLRYTRVTVIPDSIGDLSSLEYLCCYPSIDSQDFVIKIPKSILNCNSLKTLDLNRRSIEGSPLIIEELRKRGVRIFGD